MLVQAANLNTDAPIFKPVKIDGYARKRELLLGEISRRRQALASYREARRLNPSSAFLDLPPS